MKTKSCHCCSGSGEELDHVAVGAELKKLREGKGLTLKQVGSRMDPKVSTTFIWDLERGRRNWNLKLVAKYQQACK